MEAKSQQRERGRGRRKSGGGNPLAKGLSRLIDDVAGEVVDGLMDVASGPKKSKKRSGSSDRSTDWATRTEGPAPRRDAPADRP